MRGNFLGQRSSLADFSASPLTLGSNKQIKTSGQQGALTPARLGHAVDRICTMWVATYNQEAVKEVPSMNCGPSHMTHQKNLSM